MGTAKEVKARCDNGHDLTEDDLVERVPKDDGEPGPQDDEPPEEIYYCPPCGQYFEPGHGMAPAEHPPEKP